MAEYFDLLSPTGEPLGITKERNAVHRDGDWHPSVHIFVIQGDRVLLQRRKWDKESFPGKLDLACTGHVDAGEDYLTAARRELQEELNLAAGADDLRYLFTQKLGVYLLNPAVPLTTLRYQAEEIDELVWVDRHTDITGADYCLLPAEWHKAMGLIFGA